jgi:hypothetical protein
MDPAIDQKLTSLEKSVADATTRVQSDVANLRSQIAILQAKIDAGTATPADLARFDALQVAVDALDPTVPVVIPPPTA